MKTKPVKCTTERGYAHRWDIGSQNKFRYMWGKCRYCKKRRLFRISWPDISNWASEREKRLHEEEKESKP